MNFLGSLTRKFLLVGAVTFLYIAALISTGLSYSAHHAGDAARINLAGQMRYRTFEITWLAHQLFEEAVAPGATLTRKQVREELLGKILELDRVMLAVRDGRAGIGLSPLPIEKQREHFKNIFEEWNEQFRPLFVSMANLRAAAPESESELLQAQVDPRIQAFVSTIDGFVTSLQEHHDRGLARLHYFGYVAAVLFLVVGGAIVLFLRQSIVLPVRKLRDAALALDEGKFDVRVEVGSRDELGGLGRSFNQMAETLKTLLTEMRERVRELEGLNKIAQAANRTFALDTRLDQVLESILEIDSLKFGKRGAIFLVDEQENALMLAASCSLSDEQKISCARVPFGDCLCGLAVERGEMILSASGGPEARHTCCCAEPDEHGHVILPLKTPQGTVGVICLYPPAQLEISERARAVFQSVADIVAVSVQDALSHRRIAMLAQALESSQDTVIITSLDGKIVHVNPAAASLVDYPREDLVGRELSLLFSQRNPGGLLLDIFRETAAAGWCGELEITRRDGSDILVQLTTSAVRAPDGGAIALVSIAKDISERKAADERLRESEARFRRLAENAKDIIYTIRFVPDPCFEYVNPAVSQITGYTPEEYYSDPALAAAIIQPADLEFRRYALNKDFDATRFILFRWLRKDGSVVWTEQRNVPICDEAGNLVAVQGIARDITEKRQTEQHLEDVRNRLVEAQRIAHLGNWDWELASDRTFCSDEVFRIFGFESDKCLWSFRDFLGAVHPEERSRVDGEMRGAIERCEAFRSEYRILRRDGSECVILQHGECEGDIYGKAVRIFGTIQDITERKQAEEDLRRSELSLRNAQRIASLGSWDWDITNDKLVWSDEVYNIFGSTPQEFPATYEAFLAKVHPEDRSLVERSVRSALAGAAEYGSDHRILLPDGRERVVHEQAEVLRDAQGRAQRMTGTVQDITERKHLEEQLRQYSLQLEARIQVRTRELVLAKEASEAANRAKSEFLANMSHELRTPLNSVIGFSGLLADGLAGPVTNKQNEYLLNVIESSHHLLSLINDILDLSKVESGRMMLDLSEFSMRDLVTGALTMFREKAFRHALWMTSEVEEGVGIVSADERLVKQVLYNLLSNAVKFTPEGGQIQVTARIVRLSSGGGRDPGAPDIPLVEVSVVDSGIGISAEDQKKLFQPFQQVDSTLTKKYSGTGLGLSLCKRFVELHGGTIGVRSEPGSGTTFTFTIPVRPCCRQPERAEG